ncbi:MAG: hypothetical protein MJ051_02600 [Akkermansia sp.]|nr:hypothetical protein [Akkermansia sp.]
MFLVTFIGSIIASLFALCGLLGGVVFFLDAQQGMSLSAFISGFTAATWPLLAACLLFALLEILKELHAQGLADEKAETPKPAEKRPPAKATKTAAAEAGPVYFPVRETPQGPRIIRPDTVREQADETADKQDDLTFFKTR